MNQRDGTGTGRWSRRAALKQIGTAGAGVLLAPCVLRSQSSPLVVNGTAVEVIVASVSAATVRLTVTPIDDGAARFESGALVAAAAGKAVGRHRDVFPAVKAGDLVVRLTREPLTLTVETAQGTRVQTIGLSGQSPRVTFALGKGPLLGFGEGGQQFDRRGHAYTNRNGQGGYQLRTHGSRVPVQWLVSTDGWGLFVHRPLGAFDLTGADGVMTPGSGALPVDVFVTASPDPTAIMREYARLIGFAELPPRWSFGYMQSHRTLGGRDEIMSVARTFRDKKLPCDALIYLGTEFTPSGWNTRNGEFDWKKENFPDAGRMIDEMHAQHFKVVLHVVIEGRRMAGAVSDPCTPDKAVPSGRTPDDRWPEDRAVPCYWPYHKPLYDLGIDGMWPDQGDGLDEPSRLARIRMYWEGPQQYRPNERPFALHRNGSPGMQRYAAFIWSGDVFSTWETLKTHIPIAVNTGLSGLPFWGTDIGGFVPTAEYTGELHVRWFQFGTFCPSFRAHGRNWHLRLPWGWNLGKLPLSEIRTTTADAADPDPAELNNPKIEPIVKKYLELRYRMLPYTYTIARECTQTGLPMMRALWLHHPGDANASARGDQFLWGRDVLVSPVVEKGAATRRLYLPRGKWFDFWTNEILDGGREIERAVDLETMPLHVRAGAILPTGPVKQYVDEAVDEPVTITIYPGADGAFTLYEDDGKSFAYRTGMWMGTEMTWNDAARRLTLRLAAGSRMIPAGRRTFTVRLAGQAAGRTVRFEGRAIDMRLA
jgi:alpha-glucosidase (family GH31 glycosyl hydrolase)